jgi:hypothetical protein
MRAGLPRMAAARPGSGGREATHGGSKYCYRVHDVDQEQRTCVVEPGIVLDVLNDQLKPAVGAGLAGVAAAVRARARR